MFARSIKQAMYNTEISGMIAKSTFNIVRLSLAASWGELRETSSCRCSVEEAGSSHTPFPLRSDCPFPDLRDLVLSKDMVEGFNLFLVSVG